MTPEEHTGRWSLDADYEFKVRNNFNLKIQTSDKLGTTGTPGGKRGITIAEE